MKRLKEIKRYIHIPMNIVNIALHSTVVLSTGMALMLFLISCLLMAGAPITNENVKILIENVPFIWFLLIPILFSFWKLIDEISLLNWKPKPKRSLPILARRKTKEQAS